MRVLCLLLLLSAGCAFPTHSIDRVREAAAGRHIGEIVGLSGKVFSASPTEVWVTVHSGSPYFEMVILAGSGQNLAVKRHDRIKALGYIHEPTSGGHAVIAPIAVRNLTTGSVVSRPDLLWLTKDWARGRLPTH